MQTKQTYYTYGEVNWNDVVEYLEEDDYNLTEFNDHKCPVCNDQLFYYAIDHQIYETGILCTSVFSQPIQISLLAEKSHFNLSTYSGYDSPKALHINGNYYDEYDNKSIFEYLFDKTKTMNEKFTYLQELNKNGLQK